ncbi:hypothetical protein ACFC5H_30105, partial [Streptomyces rochei]|uniref:hypothetical protein n=1 Tax=Streptomyces rochei TaxID=1928 RepID=UPI00342DCD42
MMFQENRFVQRSRRLSEFSIYRLIPERNAHLEVLTKASNVAVGDQADGEAEEGFVDVVASL